MKSKLVILKSEIKKDLGKFIRFIDELLED
jgi:hypothetical protein